jgi:hypothetical protein
MADDAGGHAALGDGTLRFLSLSYSSPARLTHLDHSSISSAKLLACARASKEAEQITSRKQASYVASGGG